MENRLRGDMNAQMTTVEARNGGMRLKACMRLRAGAEYTLYQKWIGIALRLGGKKLWRRDRGQGLAGIAAAGIPTAYASGRT
jgi:hypothetical protein